MFYKVILLLTILFLCSCTSNKNKVNNPSEEIEFDEDLQECSSHINLFGFKIDCNSSDISILDKLNKSGILKIDSLKMNGDEIEYAIVEFGGVRFGLNNGFYFITSEQTKEAALAIIHEIEKYYGDPEIDDTELNVEPEWAIFNWNSRGQNPNDPWIRVRPLRSEEGGLSMIWAW